MSAGSELTGTSSLSSFSNTLRAELARTKFSLDALSSVKDLGSGKCALSFNKTHFHLTLERTEEGPQVTELIQVRSL